MRRLPANQKRHPADNVADLVHKFMRLGHGQFRSGGRRRRAAVRNKITNGKIGFVPYR